MAENNNNQFQEIPVWTTEEMQEFNCKNNAPFGENYAKGDENLIVSKHIFVSQDNDKAHSNSNMMVLGGPDSGKTYNVIRPNLMRAYGSYITIDPFGNLLKDSREKLTKEGYQIKVLDFRDPKTSAHYNPLSYAYTGEDVMDITNCILDNACESAERMKDPFWNKTEATMLNAVLLYLLHFCPENERTLAEAAGIMNLDEDAFDALFERARNIDLGDQALLYYDSARLASAKTRRAARISLSIRLAVFRCDPDNSWTSGDTIELDKICDTKTAVFITGMANRGAIAAMLVPMFLMQAFTATMNHVTYDCKDGRAASPLTMLIDELPNLGKIPRFPTLLTTCGRFGISVIMAMQAISQIRILYGDADATAIFDACRIKLMMYRATDFVIDKYAIKVGPSEKSDMQFLNGPMAKIMEDSCVVFITGMPACVDEKYTN